MRYASRAQARSTHRPAKSWPVTLAMFVAMGGFLGLCRGAMAADASGPDKVYEDKDSGFKITAPAAWEQRQTKEALLKMVFTVDGGPSDAARVPTFEVSVTSKATLSDDRLAEAVKAFRASDARDNGKVGDNEDLTLDGAKAVRYAYSGKKDDKDFKAFRVIAIRQHKMYQINFSADPATYDARETVARKVVESWKWTD